MHCDDLFLFPTGLGNQFWPKILKIVDFRKIIPLLRALLEPPVALKTSEQVGNDRKELMICFRKIFLFSTGSIVYFDHEYWNWSKLVGNNRKGLNLCYPVIDFCIRFDQIIHFDKKYWRKKSILGKLYPFRSKFWASRRAKNVKNGWK